MILGVSRCLCGHIGDIPTNALYAGKGEPVQHGGLQGHGPCLVRGCKCSKFTWSHRIVTIEKSADPGSKK